MDYYGDTWKRKRDKSLPRAPISAYLWFCKENREDLNKQKSESDRFLDVSRRLGERWKTLSEKKKDVYTAKARADKERYEQEIIKSE